MSLNLEIRGIMEGKEIPTEFTCDGRNVSPEISLTGIPSEAKSLALIMEDPDAPVGLFVHWVIYNISPKSVVLPEGIEKSLTTKEGFKQGKNDFGRIGYDGPCPPKGHGYHRYYFVLYALDFIPDVKGELTRKRMMEIMENHITERKELMGRYRR